MSSSRSATTGTGPEESFFEQQRDQLVSKIALSLEHVLMNLNLLNRSLEGVIVVGKEFESVEALWSQFENVMGKSLGEARGDGDKDETTLWEMEDRCGKQPAR